MQYKLPIFHPRKHQLWQGVAVVSLVALITNLFVYPPSAKAVGTLTSAKDTISDSTPGASSVTHTFSFVTASTGSIKQINYDFCTTASGACDPTGPTGVPTGLVTTSASQGTVTGLGSGSSTVSTNGRISYVVTSPVSVGSGTTISIPYSSITNPTTANTTYYVRITTFSDTGTTAIDTVTVAFATLANNSVTVTASVDPTFTFSIAAATSGTVNGATINVTSGTSASTVPFGTLSPGSTKIAAHDVTVTTNASNGYIVSLKIPSNSVTGNPPLYITNSASSANIDAFSGTYGTPTTWTSPAGTSASVNSGFFGYTTEDTGVSSGGFSSDKWAGPDTTARTIISTSSATGNSGTTTRIGWQAEVNNYQQPGSYTGTVILAATPTY